MPSSQAAETILTEPNLKAIHRKLVAKAADFSKRIGADDNQTASIVLSITELGAALAEAATDLSFVKQRRGVASPSIGKVAGVLTFRLCRHDIFHLPAPLAENPKFTSFKENVVIAFIFHDVLKMSLSSPWISGKNSDAIATATTGQPKLLPHVVRELKYMLTRRHYNQEILGVVFDSMRVINQMAAQASKA